MKIITLSCTQKRQPSLTDAALMAATEGFLSEAPDAEVVRIRLIDYNIRLCEAEDSCLDPAIGRCTLQDDFERVVAKAVDASAMILGMPAYAGNVPAVLKIFQERLKSFMLQPKRPFGGLTVCTIVHSRTMMTESALGALFPWYTRLQNTNVVSVCFTQAGHEDVTRTKVPELCFAAGQQLALSFSTEAVRVRSRSQMMAIAPRRSVECGEQDAS